MNTVATSAEGGGARDGKGHGRREDASGDGHEKNKVAPIASAGSAPEQARHARWQTT